MSSEQQGSMEVKLRQQFAENIKNHRKAVGTLNKIDSIVLGKILVIRGHREAKKVCFKYQNQGNVIELVVLSKVSQVR